MTACLLRHSRILTAVILLAFCALAGCAHAGRGAEPSETPYVKAMNRIDEDLAAGKITPDQASDFRSQVYNDYMMRLQESL